MAAVSRRFTTCAATRRSIPEDDLHHTTATTTTTPRPPPTPRPQRQQAARRKAHEAASSAAWALCGASTKARCITCEAVPRIASERHRAAALKNDYNIYIYIYNTLKKKNTATCDGKKKGGILGQSAQRRKSSHRDASSAAQCRAMLGSAKQCRAVSRHRDTRLYRVSAAAGQSTSIWSSTMR